MNPFWSQNVGELMPYVPGEQPADSGVIKLNTNESPFPPSPAAMEAIARVSSDELRRYPDPEAWELRRAIAAVSGSPALRQRQSRRAGGWIRNTAGIRRREMGIRARDSGRSTPPRRLCSMPDLAP